jgi:hypothetical protein
MVNCPALEAAHALIRSTLWETPAIAWLSLAALSQEQQRTAGRRVGLPPRGGSINLALFRS